MIEKLKAHEWKQTNFYTINEEALKATFRTLNNGAKANASESELEEIQQLEDEAFEF
jgi:hypothetical protein